MAIQRARAAFFYDPLITAMLAGALVVLAFPNAAHATEEYATQTGKSCTQCHRGAKGGKLNAFGKKFKANGNKLATAAK